MNIHVKTYILISLLNIALIITENVPIIWERLIHFISIAFIGTFILVDYTRNYFYLFISVLLSSLISCLYFLIYFNNKKGIIISFEIGFLLLLSILTYVGLLISLYHLKNNNDNEAPDGNKGYPGIKGKSGNRAPLLNTENLCYQQLILESNKQINNSKYKLNNLFIKQHFKGLCQSDHFKNYVRTNGDYKAISFLKDKVSEWISIIIRYEEGLNFLNDFFEIPENWKALLSKKRELHETTSPILLLKRDPVWNW